MPCVLSAPARQAIDRLNRCGYAAYAVGGCVRDMLRGVTPHDYDICTAALPRQIHACFAGERVIDTGVAHGTVTVLLSGSALEITTFRRDGDYPDGRHPRFVDFTPSLEEDLRRRDFTVNAMAFHPDEGVVDPFGGREDLAGRRIRCVGEPAHRLTEDALRILRGVRFAATLGFSIETDTARAMHALRERLALVSRERVAEELVRTVQAEGAAEALAAFSDVLFAALPDYPADALEAGLQALGQLPPGDAPLRMAALLHKSGEPALQQTLASLHASRAFCESVLQLARCARHPFAAEDTALQSAALGEKQLCRLLTLQQACGVISEREAARRRARLRAAQAANLPFSLRELPINGDDLKARGLEGAQIGQTLARLHAMVLRGEIACDRALLLGWISNER